MLAACVLGEAAVKRVVGSYLTSNESRTMVHVSHACPTYVRGSGIDAWEI